MNRNTEGPPNVWQDVKWDIESKILAGIFAAGERIPSARQIAESYCVGLSTGQKVLKALWHDGIIERRRGIGYFVRPFVREKIVGERKKGLERQIIAAMDEAETLGVDLLAMVQQLMGGKAVRKE